MESVTLQVQYNYGNKELIVLIIVNLNYNYCDES